MASPGRGEPWAAPPGSKSWDLLSGEFGGLLKALPDDIVGVGAENGCVWVALDDARAIIELVRLNLCLIKFWCFWYVHDQIIDRKLESFAFSLIANKKRRLHQRLFALSMHTKNRITN